MDLAASLGLNAYRFSVEWARVEPEEGLFDEGELDHYEAIVDRCVDLGLAPVVTFNHFTSPHWFAARGGWLDPSAPDRFAAYCRVVAERFGDRIAVAVTLNEPEPRASAHMDAPAGLRPRPRAGHARGITEKAEVPRYRLSNVMLPEEMDAMADGMEAGHRAGKTAIKAACPTSPWG